MRRRGLRIRGSRGHPEVRGAYVRFARWLRKSYEFPIRVPVYLSQRCILTTIHGEPAVATFLAPFDREAEPYIRIATGDYPAVEAERGRDDALAEFIHSLAHEIVHYFQWVETGETTERGVCVRARTMLRRYACTVDHP
jgi:hypothetical protein